MALTGSQKFAVMLCKFSDSSEIEPAPKQYYSDFFLGPGGLNDYWHDASLGAIDLQGTEIMGWKVFPQTRDDFIAAYPSRWGKILGAIDVFAIDIKNYSGFVAIFNVDVDDGGNQNSGVVVGPNDVNLTFVGHETGHVFGLQHSFDESTRKAASWSAPGEYFDPYDIMSAMNVDSDSTMPYAPKGPRLNVVNLDIMGWLPPSRVLMASAGNSSESFTFDLVSLDHPEIPGYLAAKIGDLYIEFRTNDRWDTGLPRETVLIHKLMPSGTNSIALASNKATFNLEWQPGQEYSPDPVELATIGGVRVFIESFDLVREHTTSGRGRFVKKARIRVERVARSHHRFEVGPGILFGGVAQGGDGWILTPSGILKRIPPNSPLIGVLEQLARIEIEQNVPSDLPQLRGPPLR
jgi:hypothetical protein